MSGPQAIGHQQRSCKGRRSSGDNFIDQSGHAISNAVDVGFAKRTGIARSKYFLDDAPAGFMDIADPSFLVGFDQAATDVEARRVVDLSAVEDRVIGRAAADVDVEHPGRIAARVFRRARAMSGNH